MFVKKSYHISEIVMDVLAVYYIFKTEILCRYIF